MNTSTSFPLCFWTTKNNEDKGALDGPDHVCCGGAGANGGGSFTTSPLVPHLLRVPNWHVLFDIFSLNRCRSLTQWRAWTWRGTVVLPWRKSSCCSMRWRNCIAIAPHGCRQWYASPSSGAHTSALYMFGALIAVHRRRRTLHLERPCMEVSCG